MSSVQQVMRDLIGRFEAAGIDSARLDSRLLMAKALGVEATWLFNHPEDEIDAAALAVLSDLADRRVRREPMSLILGQREFWSLPFRVTADTLAPRPDSETLIEAVLAHLSDRAADMTILDLGTGTGCLLLALLSELPQAEGLGVDRDSATLDVAIGNAEALGLQDRAEFLLSYWCGRVSGQFDVIIANPPYIATAEIARLDPEVRDYEPMGALDGGGDGLDDYRLLAEQIARHLKPTGIVAFEVGAGQAAEVAALLTAAGLTVRAIESDLGGVERCVIAGF